MACSTVEIIDPWNTLKDLGYRVKHTLGQGTFTRVRNEFFNFYMHEYSKVEIYQVFPYLQLFHINS